VNYLGRLGWSLDDKTEIIGLEEMTAKFAWTASTSRRRASIRKSCCGWREYMKPLPLEQKIDGVIPFLRKMGCLGDALDEATRHKIGRVVEVCGDRLKIFSDILLYGAFFFRDPEYDLAAVKQRLHKEGMPALVREFAAGLADVQPFDAATLEARAKAFCETKGVKIGELNHALRVATTGVMVGRGCLIFWRCSGSRRRGGGLRRRWWWCDGRHLNKEGVKVSPCPPPTPAPSRLHSP